MQILLPSYHNRYIFVGLYYVVPTHRPELEVYLVLMCKYLRVLDHNLGKIIILHLSHHLQSESADKCSSLVE